MKILVDNLPQDATECPFAHLRPFPKVARKLGFFYLCTIDNCFCSLDGGGGECRMFKEADKKNDIS